MFQQLWNTFKSMRVAIILLLVILAASLFNMFAGEFVVPVDGGAAQAGMTYRNYYGEPGATLLLLFQIYSPYHSWWFTGLLFLLSLSLLVCAIDRAPVVYNLAFRPHFLREPGGYGELTPNYRLVGLGASASLESVLRKSGYRVWKESLPDGRILIDGEKYAWAHTGAWLVHIGLILLVLGGAMIARGAYIAQAKGMPGEMLSQDESAWGFNVRVDDFRVEFHPLTDGQWVALDNGGIGRIVSKDSDTTFEVEQFQPDHRFLKGVGASRLSNRIDNWTEDGRLDQGNISDYIATLTVIENGKEMLTERVEVNHPLRYKGYRFYQSSFDYSRPDAQGRWETILTVRKDRGAEMVWAGIGLVSLGLLMAMYFIPRRVMGMTVKEAKGETLLLTGHAERNRSLFEREFQKIITETEKMETKV